jgi:hypothetical protein
MDRFEYVVGLLSIITGLALADLGTSLHRLMKRRSTVRWDWLMLVIAAYIGFITVRYWYQVWTIRDFPGATNLLFFMTIIVGNFLLFLMAASVLPDEEDFSAGTIDLREFRARNSTYLWRIFLAYVILWAGHAAYFSGFSLSPWTAFIFLFPLILGAVLAFVRNRRVQIVLVAGLIAHEAIWRFYVTF